MRADWVEGALCYRAVTGIPVLAAKLTFVGVARCCIDQAPRKNEGGSGNPRSTRLTPTLSYASGWRVVAATGSQGRRQDRSDGRRTLLPGRRRDVRFGTDAYTRRTRAVLQTPGAKEKRRINHSPECPLGTGAHIRRAGGRLQRRGVVEERRVASIEGARYFRAMTEMQFLALALICVRVGEDCRGGKSRKNGGSVGWKVHADTEP